MIARREATLEEIRKLNPYRDTLDSHIKSQRHLRQGGVVTNFERHLPAPQARLAAAALKDPSLFDFLGLYFRASIIHAGRNM